MMGKFEVGQEVILLDGTSLIGRVIAVSETASVIVAYKVATEGTTGRWYSADELAPYLTDIVPQADADDSIEKWPRATNEEIRVLMMKHLPYHMVKTFDSMVDEAAALQQQIVAITTIYHDLMRAKSEYHDVNRPRNDEYSLQLRTRMSRLTDELIGAVGDVVKAQEQGE